MKASQPTVESEGAERHHRIDVAGFRAARAKLPLRPFEALLRTERWEPKRLDEAREAAADGWRWHGVALKPPVAWDELFASNRSRHYHLQAWEFLAPVLPAHQATGEESYLRLARELILDWLEAHPSVDSGSPFAWYDMAVGVRAYRLAYVLDVSARDPDCADEVVAKLVDGAVLHGSVLADDKRFAGHTNHGLYQAAGQRALALRLPELPGADDHRRQSSERLATMLGQQFTEEGVHREHSPGYHYLLLDALERILACGLVDSESIDDLADRARDALAWLTQPDGGLPRIGDTDERQVRGTPFDTTPHPALRFVATAGAEGRPPAGRLRAFPESGYAIVRDPWPAGADDFGHGVHLVQMCAFHSQAHKHADDLSFVWYEHGASVLDDAGRYGYLGRTERGGNLAKLGFLYGDPRRIYVESTRAHNTVEIDATSYSRRVKPPGSMLRGWGESDRVCWTHAEAQHGPVRHRRMLLLNPGEWLLVVDWLDDATGEAHRYCQRFHAAPEHRVEAAGDGVRLEIDGAPAPLHGIPIAAAPFAGVVRGREEPELLGWTSRVGLSFEPASTFAWEVDGASAQTFATLFSWGDGTPSPDPQRTRLSDEPLGGRIGWRTAGRSQEVAIESKPQGALSVGYRTWST